MIYYLYIKTHNQTGLKYLGQTSRDPFKYRGSGLYWSRHLKQHGGYGVTTEIITKCETLKQIEACGLFWSKTFNVVESEEWANLTEETGKGGSTGRSEETRAKMRGPRGPNGPNKKKKTLSEEHKEKIKQGTIGRIHTEASKEKMRQAALGKITSEEVKYKISQANKGKQSWLGKTHTEETKEKMRQSALIRETKKRKIYYDTP